MESELYKSIFEKGEIRGRAAGRAEASAANLVRFLIHRLGPVDPELQQRILSFSNADVLESWSEEAFLAQDEAAARRLVEKITQILPA